MGLDMEIIPFGVGEMIILHCDCSYFSIAQIRSFRCIDIEEASFCYHVI